MLEEAKRGQVAWFREQRVFENEHFNREAVLAEHFAERWAMVAAIPDGEDSAGRMKVRLATPEEVVERAYAVAHLLCEEARKRGLVLKVEQPEPKAGDE